MADPGETDITAWIDAVNGEGVNLSEWEAQFMRDITEQWLRRRVLTDAQRRVLERIYTDRTP